jgi:HAD superfamily hydrolase (TIGR01544 family)
MDYTCDGDVKKKKMLKWWDLLIELVTDAKITIDRLKKSVNASNIALRDQVDDFIKTLFAKNIPLLVLSGGLGNVVIELLKENMIVLDNLKVFSNTVQFDKHGNAQKFISETIHMYNKNQAVLFDGEYYKKIENRPNVIVIGDAEGNRKVFFLTKLFI